MRDHAKSQFPDTRLRNRKVTLEIIPFEPLRGVRTLTGKHAELLLAKPSTDFVKAVLTDDVPIIDAMKRLRKVFPNTCDLTYARDEKAPEIKSFDGKFTKLADPLDVIGDFLELVRNERMTDEDLKVVTAALHDIRNAEDTA